ncbi:hypothetical protein B0A55_02037 [Friedmanniomyces simplex]|uniref:CUE domain-containing protein n=1 Tax=Friedmanniomyces simplex TaxID=329884 RepID=A0A4U0XWN8_9PEZI|nr:hypothetical protein B0A55_02037 [Friedmanniomyces simplex]
MAEAPISPVKESVTTREEPDFEDTEHEQEQEQETGRVSPLGTDTHAPATSLSPSPSPKPRVSFTEGHQEIPPPKPPRPLSPQQQAENTLIEAFPSIDTKVVKAVLQASNGRVEPAFNALLGMSDPDFQAEDETQQQHDPPPPPQPPRPTQQQRQQRQQPQTQLEADELYARQLAEQYNNPASYPSQHSGGGKAQNQTQHRYNQREPAHRGPNQQRPNHEYEYDRDHDGRDRQQERSFLDDDLPEIGKTIQQGFVETRERVNGWISTFRRRIDGEEGEDDQDEELYTSSQPGSRQNTFGGQVQRQQGQRQQGVERQNFGASQSEQLRGIRKSAIEREAAAAAAGGGGGGGGGGGSAQRSRPSTDMSGSGRRSTEAGRYDADPHELGEDEFERLELRDEDDEEVPPAQPPRTSSRKSANPELFKSLPKPPQSGPVDEVDAADRRSGQAGASWAGGRKWQPLTSAAPVPVEEDGDGDSDPFALGDDEEERVGGGGEEVRKEDSERLKREASQVEEGEKGKGGGSGSGSGEGKKLGLEESERKGSIDAQAAELLGGGKKE